MTASAAHTRATITYYRYPDDYGRRPPHLTIVRGGITLSTTIRPRPQARRVIVADKEVANVPVPLVVRDLDGDGEPEVQVMLFWGGMRCCFWSRVYRFDARAGRYRAVVQFWGNGQDTPVLRDLNHDGSIEFVAHDGRFAGVTQTYAYLAPVRIWSYRRGAFVDVTRRFPAVIRGDARTLWRRYRHVGRGVGARIVLAAWVGDEYRLGRRAAADAQLQGALTAGRLDVPRSEHMPSSREWVSALQVFLRRAGY